MTKTYFDYRKQVYASINGTKDNLITLSKSKLLLKDEKEQLEKVIEALEALRLTYYTNQKTTFYTPPN